MQVQKAVWTWKMLLVLVSKMMMIYFCSPSQRDSKNDEGYEDKNFQGSNKYLGNSNQKRSEVQAHFEIEKIMTDNKDIFNATVSNDDVWIERISKLDTFGAVDNITGEFKFKQCEICNSPWIAHETTENSTVCERVKRGVKFSEAEIFNMEEWIKAIPLFRIKLAEIDQRQRACHCDDCSKTFKNRAAYETHLITEHKMMNYQGNEELGKENNSLIKILSTMEKMFNKSVDSQKPVQLVKPKLPPLWIGQAYEVFEKEVQDWSKASQEDDFEKYSKVMEGLKKNGDIKDLKEFVVEVLMPDANNKDREELSVEFILSHLKMQYGKSKIEKLKDVLKEMIGFEVKSSESLKEFTERFNRLISMVNQEEADKYLRFMLSMHMIEKAHQGGLVTPEEKSRLLNTIQIGEKPQERVPVEEKKVIQNLKGEVFKIKIENNVSESQVSRTYFENGRSRYDNWKMFRNSNDFSKFRKSESRPGYWRSDSRYVRDRSNIMSSMEGRGFAKV